MSDLIDVNTTPYDVDLTMTYPRAEVICLDEDRDEFTVTNRILDNANSIVTYKGLSEIASDLCRIVPDDQLLCKSTYIKLHEWIGKLRSGQRFNVVFENDHFPTEASDNRNGDPIAAIVTVGGGSKRKKDTNLVKR